MEEKSRERLLRVQRMREKGRKILRLRLGRDHEEVEAEAYATMLSGGNTDEARKRLIGFIIAEERDFVSGIPVPALVLYRFLSQWGEFAMGLLTGIVPGSPASKNRGNINPSPRTSFLLMYTVSAVKALVQSALVDLPMLSYCMSTVGVILHLLYKELYDEYYDLDENFDEVLNSKGKDRKEHDRIRLPSLDLILQNSSGLFNLVEDEVTRIPVRRDNGEGSWPDDDDKGEEHYGEKDGEKR